MYKNFEASAGPREGPGKVTDIPGRFPAPWRGVLESTEGEGNTTVREP